VIINPPDELQQMLRAVGKRIESYIPSGCGFALFLFVADGAATFYISNGVRGDMFKLMREHLKYVEWMPHEGSMHGVVRDDQNFSTRDFREVMEEPLRRIRRIVKMNTPDGTEHAALVFEWQAGGSVAYETTVGRDTMVMRIRAWLDAAEAQQS
jgi:hypothetical protein